MPWYIGTKSQEGRVKKKWRRVSSSKFYHKGGRNFWKISEPIYVQELCMLGYGTGKIILKFPPFLPIERGISRAKKSK